MKIDNIFFKFLIVISILLLIILLHKNIREMFQDSSNDESFIKTEIDKLELLNSFTDLFENESDSVLVSDTTNINMDSMNNRVNNAE